MIAQIPDSTCSRESGHFGAYPRALRRHTLSRVSGATGREPTCNKLHVRVRQSLCLAREREMAPAVASLQVHSEQHTQTVLRILPNLPVNLQIASPELEKPREATVKEEA